MKKRTETHIYQIKLIIKLINQCSVHKFQRTSIDKSEDEVISSSIIDACCGIINSGCTRQMGV